MREWNTLSLQIQTISVISIFCLLGNWRCRWVAKEFIFSFFSIVLSIHFPETLWQKGDRNLIKRHSVCTVQWCPRFRWHELIWIIHWDGIVTSFQAMVIMVMSGGAGWRCIVAGLSSDVITSCWELKWIYIYCFCSAVTVYANFTFVLAISTCYRLQ
jgi:hypothetical protein